MLSELDSGSEVCSGLQVPAASAKDRHEPDGPAGGAAARPVARHSGEETSALTGRGHVDRSGFAGGESFLNQLYLGFRVT